jgi:hypothetical protein
MRVLSLFAGIGGLDLRLGANGCTTVAYSEIDPHGCAVMARHFPDAVNLGDVMRNGIVYRRPRSVPPTSGTAYSCLPTPSASDFRDRGNTSHPAIQRRMRLGKQVMLSMLFDREPCPLCVEGMMGFPRGWSATG